MAAFLIVIVLLGFGSTYGWQLALAPESSGAGIDLSVENHPLGDRGHGPTVAAYVLDGHPHGSPTYQAPGGASDPVEVECELIP